MARNKKVEILSHDGQVLHPITDGDCVIFPDGKTLTHKLSEDEAVMYTPEVTNSSPMFKVGEGDSSDYSANVLDGAYQEAVLKGQTYVNAIQEPSADVITLPTPFTEYERTQSKTFTEMQDGTFGLNLVGQSYVNCIQEPSEPSYVALGENLEFQNKKVEYTTDGQIKSAMLKGQTLVNICSLSSSLTVEKKTPNSTTINNTSLLKTSTKYLIMFTSNIAVRISFQEFDIGNNFLYNNWHDTRIGRNVVLITTNESTNRIKVYNSSTDYSITISDVMILEYQEGMENWNIPYFQGMQSVTMSTELENVCSRYNSGLAKGGKTFTVGSINDRTLKLADVANIGQYNFKQNTKYLIQFKIANLNLDGLSSTEIRFYTSSLESGNCLFENGSHVDVSKNGIYRAVFTTTNVISTSSFEIKGVATEWENSTSTSRKLTISQIMCIEYQNGMENWDLPYFETTQLMKPFKVRTMSKNLCPVGKGQFFNCFFKAGTQFTLSTKDGIASNGGNIVFKDKDGNSMWLGIDSGTSISRTTLAKDAYQIVNQLNSEAIQYQLEEGASVTSFVPREEKTISALEPITLRAIGNVKDTLDLSTGEYVQRIGEITFDGSEDWTLVVNGYQPTNTNYINFDYTNSKIKQCTYLLCDKIATRSWEIASTELNSFSIGTHSTNKLLRLCIEKTKLTTNNVTGLKAYLASNPIKVQYELAKPITRKISLEYPNLQTYTDITYIQSIAMDGTLIPNIYLPSDIVYKTLLKPSTKYNLQLKQNVVNTDNPLRVNVGGTELAVTQPRTLITTPSTLTSETVSFTGKGNDIGEVMLIENNTLLDGDIPYFEGIGDVHLGRVVENLCMANEKFAGGGSVTGTYYNDRIELKITKAGSAVAYFPLTKQLKNGKKYFVYSPSITSNTTFIMMVSFKRTYNNSTSYAEQVADVPSSGKLIFTIDDKNTNPYDSIVFGNHGSIPVNTTMTMRRPILCEYVDGMENWDWESIGYFTGTKNIGNEFMRIGNKNLFDGKLELGGYAGTTGEPYNANDRVRSINKTYLKPGVYYLSSDNATAVSFGIFNIDGTFRQEHANTSGYKLKLVLEREAYTHITVINPNLLNAKIQLEEATSATSYVAHKHNSLHILPNEQIPLTFVQGVIIYGQNSTWESAINNTNTNRIRTQLLDLEPNETYRISCGSTNHSFTILGYDNNLLGKSDSGWTYDEYYFTTTKDVHKYAINVRYKDNSNITPSALHQVRLEKVTDVHLRSIKNVKDELDLTRGVYVQRINEKILDGSYGISRVTNKDTCTLIQYNVEDKKQGSNYNPISNKFNRGDWDSRIPYEVYCGNSYDMYFMVPLSLNITTIDEAKAWFKNNNVIVQYELATPIEHKINIPMKNESNQTIAKPNGIFTLPLMYSETNHVDINSQIYPKVQSRDYISYPVIANNSQLHTVFHNKVGTGNLTVNLCGTSVTSVDGASKCTVTTPSAISQYELRLSGARNKVSNVCVFSGDYMNVNVPYVQGMMNAVNPTVKNIGKNLFDGVVKNGEGWWNGKVDPVAKFRRSVNLTPVKPNTEYSYKLANGRGVNFMAHGKDGEFLRYMGWFTSNITKFTTPSDCYYIHWYNDIDDFTDFYIEESPTPSQYEPYKENNCEPENGQIKLTKDMFEQGTVSGANGIGTKYEVMKENSTVRLRSKDIIRVKPNTSYRLFRENGYTGWCVAYDSNKGYLGKTYDTEVFTTDSQTCYIVPVLRNISGTTMTLDKVEKFRLVEVDETIHLRSLPNGVCDELNFETGEYIQRIGEYILDGSDDEGWRVNTDLNSDKTSFFYLGNGKKPADMLGMSAEKTSYASAYGFVSGSSAIRIQLLNKKVEAVMCGDGSYGMIQVMVAKDKLYSDDLNGFKDYLSRYPLKVQYQLATPIIKHVDIHNYPHSYKDGHVIIESNDPSTNVSAQLTYQCVTNRSGQIQEHTEQVEKQEKQINELETLILENIRQNQNRSQNFLTSLISTLEIEEE